MSAEGRLERAHAAAKSGMFAMRTCWECNSSHKHLAVDQDWVLLCFGCGHYFFEGVDITQEGSNDE